MVKSLSPGYFWAVSVFIGLATVDSGALAQAPPSARPISGKAIDTAGNPVPDVEVNVVGHGDPARTGSDGTFRLFAGSADVATVQFRRIGFEPRDTTVRFGDYDSLYLRVILTRAGAVLPTTVVTARGSKPGRYAGTTKYDEFFYRREKLNGVYMMREEIERFPSGRLASIIGAMPGMRSRAIDPGTIIISSNRCSGMRFALFVDGVEAPAHVLSTYLANEIEAIEVYRSTSELPPPARGMSACGAIFLWTRDRE